MNLQDYLPVPSIPIHYHKVIFLAASENKLSLYSPIPPIPDKRGLNDIPSGPFKNPIVYRIFERMSSHDERTLKQFMLELNSMKDPEERLAFLDKSPQIRSCKLLKRRKARGRAYTHENRSFRVCYFSFFLVSLFQSLFLLVIY